jgi:hypothetical protein
MGKAFLNISAFALITGVAFAAAAPVQAAPAFVQAAASAQSDIVRVQDSKIIRREDSRHDGVWKKRRFHSEKRHERRHDAHDFDDFDGRAKLYRPKATPKYAYDAYGNLRIYDGDGWDGGWDKRDRWDGDRWDWDKKKRKRPRIYKMNSLGYQEPSPGLKGILTTVPD